MNRLREIRESLKMSQEELSEKSGVSRTTISNLENDKVTVSKTDTLTKIADALNETVTAVFFCA